MVDFGRKVAARLMNLRTGTRQVHQVSRLVLVDDHDLVRAGLRGLLQGERSLEIIGEAASGREALALCRRTRPDLVLMDIRMPDTDGLAVTRAIKLDCPSISVILFTLYESPEYLIEALKAGAAGYLLKRSSRAEILTAVHKVLDGDSLLNPELVMCLLRDMSATAPQPPSFQELTPREHEVLSLVVLGKTNREIAETLTLTVGTVKTHLEHLISKLAVSDRTQAAVRAIELGLVRSPNS